VENNRLFMPFAITKRCQHHRHVSEAYDVSINTARLRETEREAGHQWAILRH
jgi:hypothetical protein